MTERATLPRGLRCALAAIVPLLVACQAGSAGPFLAEPAELAWEGVEPGGPAARLTVRVTNEGSASARLVGADIVLLESACGTFEVVGNLPESLPANRPVAMDIAFVPRADAPGGCGCLATATLSLIFDVAPFGIDVPLAAGGTCDAPVRCVPTTVVFPSTLQGQVRHGNVTCWNVGSQDVEVESAGVMPGGDPGFGIGVPDLVLPSPLGPGAAIAIPVSFKAGDGGEFAASLEVKADGRSVVVPMTATGERLFPRCSEGHPADPDPVLVTKAWTVVLESDVISSYAGTIRDRWYYDNQAPLIGDFLLTSGGLADPACPCGESGHEGWCNCGGNPGDLFLNVHAFPIDDRVRAWVRRIQPWDHLEIRGWEVDHITYPDGSGWHDAGCHTLILTWICET